MFRLGRPLLCTSDVAPCNLLVIAIFVALWAWSAPTPAMAQGCTAEIEPNDRLEAATPWQATNCAEGELIDADVDLWQFVVDETLAQRHFDLRVSSTPPANIEICLNDEANRVLQCREGEAVALVDLAPGANRYVLQIRNRDRTQVSYSIEIIEGDDLSPELENEPNDKLQLASPIGERGAIRGRSVGREDDFYSFVIEGEAQLWRVQVNGEGVNDLAFHDSSGNELLRRSAEGDNLIRIENLHLFPGTHYIRVRSTDSEYALRLVALGPPVDEPVSAEQVEAEMAAPPPTSSSATGSSESVDEIDGGDLGPPPISVTEREPNDDDSRAQRIRFGETHSGLLDWRGDSDRYRFYLQATEYVRLTLIPPPDTTINFDLSRHFSNAHRGPGAPVVIDLLLENGDYFIILDTQTPSRYPYTLALERLNPLDLPLDLEPLNNDRAGAQPVSNRAEISGEISGQPDDREDWFRLPVLSAETQMAETQLIVTAEGAVIDLTLFWEDDQREPLRAARNSNVYTTTLAAERPTDLRVRATGAYTLHLRYDPPTTPAASAPLSGDEFPVQMALTADATSIAGFWETAQELGVMLHLTNTSDVAQPVELVLHTSDYAWSATAAATPIELAPGETQSIRIDVSVLPEVAAGVPVRLTARGQNATGSNSAGIDLTALCGIPPNNPTLQWSSAGALFGGLNVAWQALGAQPLTQPDQSAVLFAHTVSYAKGARVPREDGLTVQLAGDQPVPVVGFLLNPLGRFDRASQLHDFEVDLSEDGVNFIPVFAGQLIHNDREQAFVLPSAVMARYARLRVAGAHNQDPGLGLFKVIAQPGAALGPSAGYNIAAPSLGGHLVYSMPLLPSNSAMLQAASRAPSVRVDAIEEVSWVVGFHHNRAAQIHRVEWAYGAEGDPANRFAQIEIEITTAGPLGPWQSLGQWTLDTTVSTTQTYELDTPVWARFVRFSAEGKSERATYEYPHRLQILESPMDGGYGSILAEYGHYRQEAYYEVAMFGSALGSSLDSALGGETPGDLANNSRENAYLLPWESAVTSSVSVNEKEDWYRLQVPAASAPGVVQTLEIALLGMSTLNVEVALLDSTGSPVELTISEESRQVLLRAAVSAGEYFLHIWEPPRSIVFAWDNSGSVSSFFNATYQSLARFAQGLDPEYETIQLLPFGDPGPFLLDEWSGDSLQVLASLTNYNRANSSSNAEINLLKATQELGNRIGTRAIILLTDAESGGYNSTEALWQAMIEVEPRIFAYELSSGGSELPQDLMQDWAAVNSGDYANFATIGELETGFERAACALRRPVVYTLAATVLESDAPAPEPEPQPGQLAVVAATVVEEQLLNSLAIELILDASGSMLQPLEGRQRIDVAREVLINMVNNVIPPNTPLALRVFGHIEPDACRTDLEVALQPLDAASVSARIAGIEAKNLARTPIAASLRLVAEDLVTATGQKMVILVTDGEETCDDDPAAAIRSLQEQGIEVRINIVGFAIADDALKAQFEEWAALGGGFYFDATSAAELNSAVEQALQTPYRLLDAEGNVIATGVVNGDPVEVLSGVYTLEILSEPVRRIDGVEVLPAQTISVGID